MLDLSREASTPSRVVRNRRGKVATVLPVWIAIAAVIVVVLVALGFREDLRRQRVRDDDPSRRDPKVELMADFSGLYVRRPPRRPGDKQDPDKD
jgi:hypothetical protein